MKQHITVTVPLPVSFVAFHLFYPITVSNFTSHAVAFIYLYIMVPLVSDIDYLIQWSISSQMLTINRKFQLVDDRFRLKNLPVTSERSLSWQPVRQSPLSHANPTRDIVHA